jgi:lipopolysaccharide transport system ATP-binding protein
MQRPVIQVERLAKQYRTAAAARRHATLREHLSFSSRGAWRRRAGLVRPTAPQPPAAGFWALQDITFEAHAGEVLGIVGHNGSGKSTLLKILARITEPTAGRAIVRGRVGAMLEVGTGFHMELTGRENIYLSGAILGMRRAEIRAKFRQIVAMSGVAEFLDMPVKRYSSGMYLRLAFSVACHLESRCLLLDEVLAVGDASFQRACREAIRGLAHAGRTILLVSHNFDVVRALCDRVLLLEHGQIKAAGPPQDVFDAHSPRRPE